jgi:hypothetical protein
METSVPVAESISGDDDRPLTPMDVYEEGTDDTHISKPLDMEHFVSYTPNIFYCCIVVPHLSLQTDCTSNALTIHIAKDKSTDITTISSPLHKRMKFDRVVQRSHCSNNSGKVKGFPCLLVPC